MKRLQRITFNVKAWSPIMTDPAVIERLEQAGQKIADAANAQVEDGDPGEAHFVVDGNITNGSPRRPRVVIIAASYEARRAEAERAALTNSLDAGRH